MTITAEQMNTWTQEVNHWLDKCEAAIAERDTLRTQNQSLLAEVEREKTVVKSWLRANAAGGWIDDLRAQNTALLEALKTCEVDSDAVGADGGMSFNEDLVSAAIKLAEEKDV